GSGAEDVPRRPSVGRLPDAGVLAANVDGVGIARVDGEFAGRRVAELGPHAGGEIQPTGWHVPPRPRPATVRPALRARGRRAGGSARWFLPAAGGRAGRLLGISRAPR